MLGLVMRRHARPHVDPPAYPDLRGAPARRTVVTGLGALAVASLLPGCPTPSAPDSGDPSDSGDTGTRLDTGSLAGDIGPSGDTVYLPSESEWHTLWFTTGGFIDYRAMVYTESPSFAAALRAGIGAALAALDACFDTHGAHAFAVGDVPDAIEAVAREALAAAAGADPSEVQTLSVYVSAWDPGDTIDGDMPADTGSR